MAKRHTAAAAACLLLAGCLVWAGRKRTVTYLPDESAFPNAQIGYAPGVLDSGTEGATLRYLGLTWRQLEPEEGAYAWEAIEQTCHLAELRARGVHLVLRISCDEPGDEAHLDIPDWLYEQTGTGRWYDIAYGKGYAPDYTDPVFFAAHERLLRAVGERLGADGFVSYVELGSLGHWGEWHVKSGEGLPSMPDEAVRDRYAALYREAFPQAALLMRRPFRFAAEHELGLYNDMTGLPEDTEEWLGWIACGGWYEGDPEGLVPMPDAWQTAPIGGELTSRLSMEQLLTTDLSRTVSLIRQSHMSFLGPKTAETAFREGYDAVLAALGYRLRVTEASLRRENETGRCAGPLVGGAGPAHHAGHRGPDDRAGCRPLCDADGAGGRPHRPLCGRIEPKKPETLQKRPQAFLAADAAIRNIGNGEWQKITGCAPG